VQTALKIVAEKSVGSLSPLPFVSLLTNCVIWTYYGVLKSDLTVFVPNGIGIIAGLICVSGYHRFVNPKPVKLYAAAAAIIAFSTACYYAKNYQLLGSLGCVLAVLVTGSPLATLRTVIKEKSTAALPVMTSASAFCNACSWSMYGLLVANDPMIYGPNLMGLVLASIQMSLYVIFGLPPKVPVPHVKPVF
jgi:solute carrier family 50 (sugar transporter)